VVHRRSCLVLLLPVASVACSMMEPPASSLMPSPLTMASWQRCLCLFLLALASSSAPWTMVLGDASPPLLNAGQNCAALAWWVAMAHRSPAVLLGALTDTSRGRSGVPLWARLLVVHASIPLGSRLDLLHLSSSS
jgi:hypothetical protein